MVKGITTESGEGLLTAVPMDSQRIHRAEKNNFEVSDFELADIIEDKLSSLMRVSGNHWYIACDHGWKRDADKQIYAFVKSAIRALTDETKYYSSQRMRSVITALEGCQGLRVPVSEWDSDQSILNTPAGIVNLKTGELRKLEENDFVTKVAGVSPNESPTPLFDQFLRETFPVDHWGDAQEHVIDFLLGSALARRHRRAIGTAVLLPVGLGRKR